MTEEYKKNQFILSNMCYKLLIRSWKKKKSQKEKKSIGVIMKKNLVLYRQL